ncbi:MAG: RluA family pseudouridine synthase [Flavobacteriales bacterium]|jgi:23S rRNA pseudouridine1911/1915/1917 synthase|nr:RluA family pseudouridine synthase [Flavobacteriales bacterium]MBT7489185.1 RluA family pseudouridine synthase [Flavobacteriales bacterium]
MKPNPAPILEDKDNEDLFEHFRFVADPGQGQLRVDKFLGIHMKQTSRNRIQKAAEAGAILVNGKAVKSNHKVKPKDIVTLVLAHPPRDKTLLAEDLNLDVIYQDEDVLLVNKRAGMVVHPAHGHYSGTLINGLMHLFANLPGNDQERPGLVHRIDKDTTGILVIARTEQAMTMLAAQFADHSCEREYIAIVWGDLAKDEGVIEGYLGRSLKDRKLMAVFSDSSQGKHAITHYKVIERFRFATMISCRLETGRTHQIRAHFKSIGHPLFGDPSYGGQNIPDKHGLPRFKDFMRNSLGILPRQALHAKSLGFMHPSKGERMRFVTELPEDMLAIIERFRRYVGV